MLENLYFLPLAQVVAPPPATAGSAATPPQPHPPATAPAIASSPTPPPATAPATHATTLAVEPAAGTLAAPTEFKLTESSPNALTITWKDSDANIDGFHIYRSEDGGKTYAPQPVTKAKGDTSLTDTNLAPDHQYDYKIVAYNSKQESAPLEDHASTQSASFLSNYSTVIMAVILFGGLYFFLFRGQRKDKKKREGMIKELKKGDKVMTIGGLVARVISVDGDDVVLKIDESNNIKATYRKTAIQEVLDRDEKK